MTSWKWIKFSSHQHSAPVPEQAEEKRKQTQNITSRKQRGGMMLLLSLKEKVRAWNFVYESLIAVTCICTGQTERNFNSFCIILYLWRKLRDTFPERMEPKVCIQVSLSNKYKFFPVHLVKYSSKKKASEYSTQLPLILYIINSAKFTSSLKFFYC